MRILAITGLVLLLVGCEPAPRPAAQFDPLAVRRPLNLAKKLGTELTLAGPHDTLQLRLLFDAATGRNVFTSSANDTVLTARVFRFRGLYYFVETSPGGTNWVHAARISRGQVQGLGTGYEQMLALSRRA